MTTSGSIAVEAGAKSSFTGLLRGLANVLRFVRRNPLGSVAVLVVLLMFVMAIAAPVIAPHEPAELLTGARLAAPLDSTADGTRLWLGGDQLGRDMATRLLYGARISLGIAVSGVIGSAIIGALLGGIGAFVGGIVDAVVQRVVETLLILPVIVVAMVLVTMLGSSWTSIVFAIWLVQAPRVARIVRGEVLSIRERPFIEAARSTGCSSTRLLLRHIAPNVLPMVLVVGTIELSAAILLEGGLSFLGFGVAPPAASWGLMIREGQTYMTRMPHMLLVPGFMISLAVLAFSMVGDMIRDAFDPRLRRG
jgi:peptide/nickel transport system permease protein